jgi:hypothetical protein
MRIQLAAVGTSTWGRRVLRAVIAGIGVIVIVGSGGGFPDLDFSGPFPLSPSATVEPARVTVEVGASVSFTVTPLFATPPLSYQWQRNGVDIPGATGATYTLAGANLGDDGAQFGVRVTAANGATTASSLLSVSSAPGVVFQDADFVESDWTASAIVEPASNGPTHAETQEATGGHPGAFRRIAYQVPSGASSVRVFHLARSAVYDPAVQGAIYAIDWTQDCSRLSTSTLSETHATPMFEQGGRRFAPWYDGPCLPYWQTTTVSSRRAEEFLLIDGAACGAGEACPDFSAGAAPLRFGFVSGVRLPSESAAGAIVQGIDNWKVTIWRR